MPHRKRTIIGKRVEPYERYAWPSYYSKPKISPHKDKGCKRPHGLDLGDYEPPIPLVYENRIIKKFFETKFGKIITLLSYVEVSVLLVGFG
jgi:hypothetical protein